LKENIGFSRKSSFCDNGEGLTSQLEGVLKKRLREAVRSKYSNRKGTAFEPHHLIDYAFDRLSSSKRDIAQLIHLEKISPNGLVASGLYWVWNVVRSHQGVISIRTADACAWYDFIQQPATRTPWMIVPLNVDNSAFHYAVL